MKIKNTAINCVFDNNGSVLLIKRLSGMGNFSDSVDGQGKGIFSFPGGKLEPEESFQDCAVRECFEETGIISKKPKLIGKLEFVYSDLIMIAHVFKTIEFSGELKNSPNESEALWVNIESIPYDNMWPSEKIWAPKVIANEYFDMKFIVSPSGNISSYTIN